MSINKNYVMAGVLATALITPLSNITESYAAEIRVTTTRVNFRTGAGTNYTSIGVLEKGTKVTYIGTSGNWTKVQYNSKTGYIYSDYLVKEESSSTTTMYAIADSGLNVRKGPSTSYSKVGTLSKGTAVTVYSTSNGWSKISANGVQGYVSSKYLSNTKPSTSAGSSSSTATTTMYTTADSGLNVRKGPSTSYSKVGTLSKGTAVTVYSTSNGWSKISANGIEGYVSSKYLSATKPSTSTGSSSSTTTTTMYATADSGLNVRKGPSTSYSKVGTLSKGTAVTVYSTSNGWSKISANGIEGYVSSKYLSATKPSTSTGSSSSSNSSSVSSVLNLASNLIGKPYVWGAEGPSSFDCSGFTYYVYKTAAGITLPRVSSSQGTYGTTISKSNLKPGDLVFFDTDGSNNGQISHVGIYVGSGQMIHASSSKKKVIKSSIETTYWKNAFVRAKRVL